MIVYKDFLTDKDVASDSYPKTDDDLKGALIVLESKKITVGDSEEAINAAIGANESKEEAGEKMDESKNQVINIVHAHSLQKIELDVKSYKAMQNKYWKDLKTAIEKKRYELLGLGDDYKPPADKKEAAAAEKKAEAKVSADNKLEYAAITKRFELFKSQYKALTDWVKDFVIENFAEFEFYMAEGAELGSCMIIPARYVGEALSPNFYLIGVGIIEGKY